MSQPVRIGAHVDQRDPVAEAQARDTTLVQFFLGDPQSYKKPEVRYAGGAEALRRDAEAAGIDLYVHAPYIINVATTNNRIRIPSRKDRKSTRLNSSHANISYAVFCLKKKKSRT